MAQWGNQDQSNNSPTWAVSGFKTTANSTTQSEFFGNTTLSAFITNLETGSFGVDTDEQFVARATGAPRPAHAGWIARVEGSGGRAGRVQMETLVAMSTITGDAEDVVFPDVFINITSQPVSASGEAAEDDEVYFEVVALTSPTTEVISFQWQADTGSGFANVANGLVYDGVTTDELTVFANTAANASIRVVLSANNAADVISDEVTLTII
jgi:hypothetical protein